MNMKIVPNLQSHILDGLERNENNNIPPSSMVKNERRRCDDTFRVVFRGGMVQFWPGAERKKHCSMFRALWCTRTAAKNAANDATKMVKDFVQMISILTQHLPFLNKIQITHGEQIALGQKIGQILFMENDRRCVAEQNIKLAVK